MDAIQQAFVVESQELLQQMEDNLLQLENSGGDPEIINAIFRAAHTIKGSAGLFGLDPIVSFVHVVETALDQVRLEDLAGEALSHVPSYHCIFLPKICIKMQYLML